MALPTADYCREIESYLCRKNDGHLIRVTGPSFDLVASWAERGVPIKVACKGIDRYFERYYRKGPRRRPVRIDFCEADILDSFDEWRRATGVGGADPRAAESESLDVAADGRTPPAGSRRQSLPEHLTRVLLRLSSARSACVLDAVFDGLLDRVSAELDGARSAARSLRGASRHALIDRLDALDRELLQQARVVLDETTRQALAREADEELAPFRDRLSPEAFARSREAAIDRLVREHYNLPVIAFL